MINLASLSGGPLRRDARVLRVDVVALEKVGEGFREIEVQPRRSLVRECTLGVERSAAVLRVGEDLAFAWQHVEHEGCLRVEIGVQLPLAISLGRSFGERTSTTRSGANGGQSRCASA